MPLRHSANVYLRMDDIMKLSDLGEKEIIKRILRYVDESDLIEKGDDVASYGNIALKVDGFSIEYSKYPWNTYYDLGWKVITMVTSDLVVKSAVPRAYLVSLGLPRTFRMLHLDDLVKGLKDAVLFYNSRFLGGDLNECACNGWIDVFSLGIFKARPPGKRNKIKSAYIIVTGEYGLTSVAYYIYQNRLNWRELIKIYPQVFKTTKQPVVYLRLADIIAEYIDYIYASTDVSDGLAYSLWEISEGNRIEIEISNIPIHEEVKEFALRYDLDCFTLALYGGEEFEAILLVDGEVADEIVDRINRFHKANIIGKTGEKGIGVFIEKKMIAKKGWEYFT